MLTLEQFKEALPKELQGRATEENLKTLNEILNEPDMAKAYKESLYTYSSVLKDGKYSIKDFICAIKFCTYKLAGLTNLDSYIKTFPDRYKTHIQNGVASKDIASYISSYAKTKLVSSILEQSYIPSWLINQEYYQEAINVQADLMRNAKSEKVRSDAANSLLNHLKPPETKKIELDIGISRSSHLDDLRESIQAFTELQRAAIKSGNASVKEVAEYRIIEGVKVDE